MNEDKVKESFRRLREDMTYFFEEIQGIKRTLEEITTEIKEIKTIQHKNPTQNQVPTDNPTRETLLEAPKDQNTNTSIGNEGVPTNKPTNQQTVQHPIISTGDIQNPLQNAYFHSPPLVNQKIGRIEHLQRATEILESLDELKKEVRFKFKKLTNQEMLIFSIIYQMDELGIFPDYDLIAEKAGLTSTSIRDYVRKIMNKGIPLEKYKEDNKKVVLKIPKNLKKIASLNTILELRKL